MGTRDLASSSASNESDFMGNPPLRVWLEQNPGVKLATFAETAEHGEMVINAVNGQHAMEALSAAGEGHLRDKFPIGASNPLDSRSMPPSLLVSNTDSLGEQIHRSFPTLRVVKTLNTVNAILQVDPRKLLEGDHHTFLSGKMRKRKRRSFRYSRAMVGRTSSIWGTSPRRGDPRWSCRSGSVSLGY